MSRAVPFYELRAFHAIGMGINIVIRIKCQRHRNEIFAPTKHPLPFVLSLLLSIRKHCPYAKET